MDEIKDIKPSEFSLQLSIRKATVTARKFNEFLSYYSAIKMWEKNFFKWDYKFFEQNGIKGKDIEF